MGRGWQHKVKIRHLFVEQEDYASVQDSMNAIADVLSKDVWFARFPVNSLREIPQGDSVFSPVDYANRLLERLYDFADDERIWFE